MGRTRNGRENRKNVENVEWEEKEQWMNGMKKREWKDRTWERKKMTEKEKGSSR